ncbi:hypothetical protein P775_14675 [Puniceibacterium antarcticum]|uniref:Uncharacterized protein n=1 Tax=Puniceibacterium antarcticum TaxID=1206336 RepID=A0A2G8RD14_9RHOB|nr:hypothetical protein P775_14675 [Puniceibacterium antarcticum]
MIVTVPIMALFLGLRKIHDRRPDHSRCKRMTQMTDLNDQATLDDQARAILRCNDKGGYMLCPAITFTPISGTGSPLLPHGVLHLLQRPRLGRY